MPDKKTSIVILLATGLILAGCSKVEEPKPAAKQSAPPPTLPTSSQDKGAVAPPESAPPAPGAVASTPPAPVAATAPDVNAPKRLTDQEVTMLNYAVYKYKEQFGRFPKSLQEMVGTPHLTRVPVTPPDQKLIYDPAIGLVKVVSP